MWQEDVQEVPITLGRLISYEAAAGILDTSARTIGRLVKRGELTEVKIKDRVYITRKSALRKAERAKL